MIWLVAARLALAQEDPTCPVDGDWLDGHAHLRAISLDLRGVPPTPAEYDLLGPDGEVPASLVDAWLDAPAFADQVVRYHQSLLWNNVTNQTLLGTAQSLSSTNGIYYKRNSTIPYRGKQDQTCGTLPATFDANGKPVVTYDAEGDRQEGYVEVTPYWSLTPVKICAYDAQDLMVSPDGTDCATSEAYLDPACGCGPDLRWCGVSSEHNNVVESMGKDVDLRVARIIEEDRSYLELLQGDVGFVNGPLAYFLRYQTQIPSAIRFTESPVDPAVLPDLAFTDTDTWVSIPLGDQRAGVFTSPAYLLRFMTNRARANRFYNDFLCQPFVAPEGGIEIVEGEASADLSERPGCNYCHALLEPAAAYWGRWTMSGGGYIDPMSYPAFDEDCALCGELGTSCSDTCTRFYTTDVLTPEEAPNVGWLKSYAFLDAALADHVELGPDLLVAGAVADGRLSRCVTTRAANWLLGRQTTDDDEAWIEGLATDFAASGFRYDQLVKAIVQSDAYRRVE